MHLNFGVRCIAEREDFQRYFQQARAGDAQVEFLFFGTDFTGGNRKPEGAFIHRPFTERNLVSGTHVLDQLASFQQIKVDVIQVGVVQTDDGLRVCGTEATDAHPGPQGAGFVPEVVADGGAVAPVAGGAEDDVVKGLVRLLQGEFQQRQQVHGFAGESHGINGVCGGRRIPCHQKQYQRT